MSESMIERVARALCEAGGLNPEYLEPGDLPQIDGHKANGDPAHFLWRQFTNAARAAIEAMRDPTESMVDEATIEGCPPRIVWSIMIDDALSEKP